MENLHVNQNQYRLLIVNYGYNNNNNQRLIRIKRPQEDIGLTVKFSTNYELQYSSFAFRPRSNIGTEKSAA